MAHPQNKLPEHHPSPDSSVLDAVDAIDGGLPGSRLNIFQPTQGGLPNTPPGHSVDDPPISPTATAHAKNTGSKLAVALSQAPVPAPVPNSMGSRGRVPFFIGKVPGFPPTTSPTASSHTIEATFARAKQEWDFLTMEEVKTALNNDFARAEPHKAMVLLGAYTEALASAVTPVRLLGMPYPMLKGTQNYGGVTCYIDSLLIAMFSRMENFQPLLYQTFDDRRTETIAVWLRMFVNLFRSGHMLTYDIIRGLLASCHEAGWGSGPNGPISLQQDAAEFFGFITEKLQMPLLSLRVDIAHAGKEAAEDDHKIMSEQLLYLPIPGTEKDSSILLEECLELYFSNNISVNRHIERRGTLSSLENTQTPGQVQAQMQAFSPSTPQSQNSAEAPLPHGRRRSYSIVSTTATVHSVAGSSRIPAVREFPDHDLHQEMDGLSPVFGADVESEADSVFPAQSRTSSDISPTVSPVAPPSPRRSQPQAVPAAPVASASTSGSGQSPRELTSPLPSYKQLFGDTDGSAPYRRDSKARIFNSNNEVSFPAWMFLQLMPFYADSRNAGATSGTENLEASQVAQHFSKTRPVLGFCLKRYYVDDKGVSQKNSRKVIIPETIYLPTFVADDSDRDQAFGNFKLVLESAVFHRGQDLHSGHYTSVTSEEVCVTVPKGSADYKDAGSMLSATSSSSGPDLRKIWRVRPKKKDHVKEDSVSTEGSVSLDDTGISVKHRRWLYCDDLAPAGEKVVEVDFHTVFDRNIPYLLFYRMVALDSEEPPAFEDTDSAPSSATVSPMLNPLPTNEATVPVVQSIHMPLEFDRKGRSSGLLGRPKFLRRHHNKDKDKDKEYASRYREEKCAIM